MHNHYLSAYVFISHNWFNTNFVARHYILYLIINSLTVALSLLK